MNALSFSFIIPVYNRPDEVNELLNSLTKLKGTIDFEVLIIEDGSSVSSKPMVDIYSNTLNVSYYFKENSGPGDSRNYGMERAKGTYFIILDSDCLVPENYLEVVNQSLQDDFVDCFGGPDAAHSSFTNLQKAINFAMTSFLTTGGIRGGKDTNKTFQPRSFNMGLSKKAFESSGGFGTIHPGEDPDLSIRLVNLGFKTKLINKAYVYHKRRISWSKFYTQVYKFGMVRPILNTWHPNTIRLTYWFPSLFSIGLICSCLLLAFHVIWPLLIYGIYFLIAFVMAIFQTKNISVAIQAIFAILIQFFGYGYGFLKSTLAIKVFNKNPETTFPNLFFKHAK
ncbi:MAG: glycosyltransferase [Gelidibacter sp.]